MSLVIEDGSALSTAESYISVVDADAFHAARQNFAWPAASDSGSVAQKEAALRRATDYMRANYRGRWLGTRVKVDQALDWPRIAVVLQDVNAFTNDRGYYFNVQPNVVPVEVKQACALLALKALTFDGSGNIIDLAPDLTRATHSEKVGSLEVVYEAGSPQFTRYRAIDQLLDVYLNGGAASIKLVRG